MHTRQVVPLTLLSLVTATAALHGATASASADAPALKITETVAEATELDLGKTGPGQGDRFTYSGRLTDPHGRQVGTSAGECVSVAPTVGVAALVQCSLTYVLPDGRLSTMGLYDLTSHSNVLGIVAGTGRYRAARGVIEFASQSPTICHLTIRPAK